MAQLKFTRLLSQLNHSPIKENDPALYQVLTQLVSLVNQFQGSITTSITNISTTSVTEKEWSVLTNGDVVNPELIFAGGDVIMTHIP